VRGTAGTALLSQRKYETPPATPVCPKWTWAKRILPSVTFWPSRFAYEKTKWIVDVLSSSFAVNSPNPVVELAGSPGIR
jgi:hypothetical protein